MTTAPAKVTRSTTPPFMRRRAWVFGLSITLLVIGLNVVIALWPNIVRGTTLPRWVIWLRFGAFVPYFIALGSLLWWFPVALVKLRRRFKSGELPCWHCGYDLSRLGASGACPECGQPFTAAETRARWEGRSAVR